jgi:hypothetical protein
MMLLGLVLHSTVSFVTTPRAGWPYHDASTSVLFDIVVLFIHVFRMPLFFLMAGFFTACSTNLNRQEVDRFATRAWLWMAVGALLSCGYLGYMLNVKGRSSARRHWRQGPGGRRDVDAHLRLHRPVRPLLRSPEAPGTLPGRRLLLDLPHPPAHHDLDARVARGRRPFVASDRERECRRGHLVNADPLEHAR